MRRRLIQFSVLVLAVTALATVAGAGDLGLITGGEKGTYYQFGLDLQKRHESGRL
jgi:hypothetical protein